MTDKRILVPVMWAYQRSCCSIPRAVFLISFKHSAVLPVPAETFLTYCSNVSWLWLRHATVLSAWQTSTINDDVDIMNTFKKHFCYIHDRMSSQIHQFNLLLISYKYSHLHVFGLWQENGAPGKYPHRLSVGWTCKLYKDWTW